MTPGYTTSFHEVLGALSTIDYQQTGTSVQLAWLELFERFVDGRVKDQEVNKLTIAVRSPNLCKFLNTKSGHEMFSGIVTSGYLLLKATGTAERILKWGAENERRRRELVGGSGGILPPKILKSSLGNRIYSILREILLEIISLDKA